MSNLSKLYKETIAVELAKEFSIKNIMAVPALKKVVLNVGTGQQTKNNPKFAENAAETLKTISGQKPAVRKARKAISGFKVREGEEVGLTVTLRGQRMYDFVSRLANVALPRIRDFRGLNPNSFDKKGNLTMGLRENVIFPEISNEKMEQAHGLEITFVINSNNKDQSKKLLESLGLPFQAGQKS